MPLAACRECGKKISTEAKSCIGCGAPNPTSKIKKISKDVSTPTLIEKIKYYLNGHYSLGFSFWVVGVLIPMIVGIPLIYFTITGVDNVTDFAAFILIGYVLFYYIFIMGAIIGQWRSAGFYIQENKTPIWGYVVKVLCALTVLSLVIQVLKIFL